MIPTRRRALISERRSFENGIENIDKDDCLAIAGYFFHITKDLSNQIVNENEEVSYEVLCKLAERLGLSERLHDVLTSFVDLYFKNNILHSFIDDEEEDSMDEASCHPALVRRAKLRKNVRQTYVYDVDEKIDDFTNLDIDNCNFIRLLMTPKSGIYSQIIYYTFFSKAAVSMKTFYKELPVRYENKLHDTSKLDFLKKELNLTDNETLYLLCRYRKGTIEYVSELFTRFTKNTTELYTKVLGISKKEVTLITRSDSKLRQFGFLDDEKGLNPALIDCIDAKDLSLYFSDCVKAQDLKDVYELSSFSVPEKNTDIYRNLLKSDNSISVLLYGAPGAGKTEYAKALIKSSGKKALIFKNEAEVLDKNDVLGRLNCLLSLDRKDTVLIIDEADSLLSTSMITLFGPMQSSQKKGVVNKMLEASKNKVIWIVNYKSQIDESTLRRFTVSFKFAPMSSAMLENIALKKMDGLEIEGQTKKKIVGLLSKYKVTGASVDNLVKTINSMNNKNDEALLENIKIVLKDNSTLLHGESKMRTCVKDTYDMSVLNTSVSAEKIIKMLQNAKKFAEKNPGTGSVKILLYGLSGTGKTEFARYISQCLGKEILLKRASDIFDKYVGGTEQNIADAFKEAQVNDQILLFDEADSFFSDRNQAVRNFERTQVNEFLTQLEEFSGIVICTTNLKNVMDKAMLRRFHITVDFKALTFEGIKKLLGKFFREYEFTREMIGELSDYGTVTPGDFGRLSDTIKFMDPEEISSDYIVEQLCLIQEEKDEDIHSGRHIGFCA